MDATQPTIDEDDDADAVDAVDDHLQDVDDGCGCAEVWEHLSERREDDAEE